MPSKSILSLLAYLGMAIGSIIFNSNEVFADEHAPTQIQDARVFEVTEFEREALQATLAAANITQYEVEVKIVDPVYDPYGFLDAALVKPLGGVLQKTNLWRNKLITYSPREVNYYTVEGHAAVASCYAYMYQLPEHPDKVIVNSRQCNLIWPGIEALPNGKTISEFFSGASEIGPGLRPKNTQFLGDKFINEDAIEQVLNKID